MDRFMKNTIKRNIKGWALVFPSLLFIGLFTIYPLFKAGATSLFRENLSTITPVFVGLENYRGLLADEVFMKTLGNTIAFSLATVPLGMALALAFALAAQKAIPRLKGFLRLAWFHPTVIPLVAVANIWLFIYTPDYGLLAEALSLFGIRNLNLLGNPDAVMPAMIVLYAWKQAGYFMIFFLAGLQQISPEYYEAARIDGAGGFDSFRRITFPLLMPTTLFVFVISATASFKTVDHLLIMTRGGPDNASNLLLYYIYETAFGFWDIGKAAAMTMVLFALLSGAIVMNIRWFEDRIHYQG